MKKTLKVALSSAVILSSFSSIAHVAHADQQLGQASAQQIAQKESDSNASHYMDANHGRVCPECTVVPAGTC